ncbi:hypothetical protein HY632_02040 [Candidatus Uhrbacteria bacterium]|nr:hypothetical protein [Candidatus Uhrbacteria bacterium]
MTHPAPRSIRNACSVLWGNPGARWLLLAAGVCTAGTWIAVLAIPRIPGVDTVVTHYSTTFGIDALGSWRQLLRLPSMATVLMVMNMSIAIACMRGARADTISPAMLPPAASAILVATALLSFIALVGALFLLRVNLHYLGGASAL